MKSKQTTTVTNHSKSITPTYKNGKSSKDIIPPIFPEHRKMNILTNKENIKIKTSKEENNIFKPFHNIPEWPTEEEIEKFNLDQQKFHLEKYSDPDHELIKIPYSILNQVQGNLIWKRPSEYIQDYYLTKEITSRFPLKNSSKFKRLIYDAYFHTECPIENKKKKKNHHNNDLFHKLENKIEYTSENKRIFKTFFKIFDKQDFYIVKHREKGEDSDSEIDNNHRKSVKENIKKDDYDSTPAVNFKNANGKIECFFPRKIKIEEKSSYFTKWLSSILQFIREFNINDDGDEPIWKKIYPQNQGVPFYNQNGRYWVKLHFMGKLRKIEIDDRMPCNKKLEPLVPKCQNIEELWPAILTKAILKLFSFKFASKQTVQCIVGDTQIIHALTGYYAEAIKIETDNESQIDFDVKKYFNKIEISHLENLSEKDRENEKNFLMFFNFPVDKSNNSHQNDYNKTSNENNNDSLTPVVPKKAGTFTNKILPTVKVDLLKNPLNLETDEILLKDFNIKRFIKNKESEIKRQEELKKKLNMETSDFDINLSPNKRIKDIVSNNKTNINPDVRSDQSPNKTLKHSSYSINQYFESGSHKSSGLLEKIKTKYHKINGDRNNNSINELEKIIEITSEETNDKKLLLSKQENIIAENEYFYDTRKNSDNNSVNLFDAIGNKIINNANDYNYVNNVLNSPTKLNSNPDRLRSILNPNPLVKNVNNTFILNNINSNNLNISKNKTYMNNRSISELGLDRSSFKINQLSRNNNNNNNNLSRTSVYIGDNRSSFISEITKSFRSSVGKNNITFPLKQENNIFYGFCYPIVEAVDTKDFNMKRLKSFDLNDLKIKLIEAKNVYRKLGKEERKNYTQTLIDLGNNFKEIKDKKISEIKAKGKNLFLLKIANNCSNAQHLNIYFEFSEEEIDVVINCVVNNWDFPPFEYYEKIANQEKMLDNEKGKSNVSLVALGNNDANNNDDLASSAKKSSTEAKLIENSNFESPTRVRRSNMRMKSEKNNNSNNLNNYPSSEIKDFNPALELKKRNSSNINSQSILKRSSTSVMGIFEELSVMVSDEYLRELYDQLIFGQRDRYIIEKKAIKQNIKGQWVELDQIIKSFDYFVVLFTNRNFKVKNNFDFCLQGNIQNNLFFSGDKENKVYFISLSKEKEVHFISYSKHSPVVDKNKKQPTNKNLIAINNNNLQNNDNPQNQTKRDLHKILIEFSSTNGKSDDLNDLYSFIVFDIFEVTELDNNSNDNNNNNHLHLNDYLQVNSINNNSNQVDNKNKKILKCILENIQLSGFYDIFYKEILKFEKDYLLYIKSAFTPFGYNLKIYTESGFVEPMSYNKFLIDFGGMKNSISIKFNVPNYQAGDSFLVGKISVKFNNAYHDNITNSNGYFSSIANLIQFIKKDIIKIKFVVNTQDDSLLQYLNLYIYKYKEITKNENHNNSKDKFFKENKIVPINEIVNLNLNEFEMNDEIIFSLVLRSPYDINEFALNTEILACSVENLIINNIDLVTPYSIEDSVILDKKYIILKEIFYVPEKVYATLFINIKRKIISAKNSTLLTNNINELETLNEVAEEQQEHDYNSLLSPNTTRTEIYNVFNINANDHKKPLDKDSLNDKIRCILKIYKKDSLILEIDFFNDLLIPNILLEGNLISSSENNVVSQHGSAKKGKDPIMIEKPDYSKISTQYKIECVLDQSEIPKWILNKKNLDWKIDVFSSETIGFVKDSTKEDTEKALIQSWEIANPGRSDKALKARIKFVEERKHAVDAYLNTFSPYKKIKPLNHLKAESMTDIVSSTDPKINNMRYNIRHKRDLSFNSPIVPSILNSNFIKTREEASIIENSELVLGKNKNINPNFSQFEREVGAINFRSDNNILSKITNLNNKNFVNPVNLSTKKHRINKSISAADLIEENINQLNEKLKAASDFYKRNKSVDFDKSKNEHLNKDKEKSPDMYYSNNNLNDSRTHVSKYIKKFLHQAHEDKPEEDKDVFNLQNCKINSKLDTPSKIKKNVDAYENKKKNLFLKLIKNENEKIKTYYNKLFIKHNFRKNESQKVFDVRNTFMTTINDNISKEIQLLEEITINFEINNLNQYVELYNSLLNSHPLKTSSNLVSIHNAISSRKDQIISLMLEKKEIKNKEQAHEILNDIKNNKWNVSDKNINALISIANAYQF